MAHLLYIIFFIKHGLADFPLQTDYHLRKGNAKDWFAPLLEHCFVHACFTFSICLLYSHNYNMAFNMACLDLVLHFTIDFVKARPKLLGKYKMLSGSDFALINAQIKEIEKVAPDGHYEIDQLKLKFKHNKYAWNALMVDQLLHYCTYALIIYILTKGQ